MKTTRKLRVAIAMALMIIGSGAMGQGAQDPVKVKPSTDSYSYKNAVGIRAGETSGLTFKHMLGNSNAVEGILSLWPHTMGITGLYEKNINVGTPGLNFYFGAGGHANLGGARYRMYYLYGGREYVYVRRTNDLALGVDGIIGLEYKFKPIPLAVSADIKPYLEVSTFGYTYTTLDPSIGIKITF